MSLVIIGGPFSELDLGDQLGSQTEYGRRQPALRFDRWRIQSILAAPRGHFMTLSALASTFGGIVRPICLAVFKLITNSNFIGCSTGRSAGFAPLRIYQRKLRRDGID